jgi:predicted N-acyltransferase
MSPPLSELEPQVLSLLSEVPAAEWDRLWAHEPGTATPFLSHAWLDALEQSGAASPDRGWSGRHLLLRRGGRLVAAMPGWVKRDSHGDFGRDWQWAAAAERAGIPYYPKLVVGVPFTPATGRRLLVAPGEDRSGMARAVAAVLRDLCAAEGIRSIHVLHLPEEDAREMEAAGLALRVDFQYQWTNPGYASFDQFLSRFTAKRRHAIRRERSAPEAQGIAIRTVRGSELAEAPARWALEVARLHERSVSRMEWGMRFLDRPFYEQVIRTLPGSLEVVEARKDGRLVAMAFNVASPERLYGRYWGAVEEHPFLHFNVALYHSIDECIRLGRKVFEGGAGGEHKLSRGFEPAPVWSAHHFLDRRLDEPIRAHLARSGEAALEALAGWRAHSAVLRGAGPR